MLRRILKSIAFAALATFLTLPLVAQSQTKDEVIHVLRLAPAGGGLGNWSDAVVQTLQDNGYKAKLVGLNSYQAGRVWLDANSSKAAVYVTFSDNAVFDKLYPDHPASAKLIVDETSLITIIGKWWNFICGHDGKTDTLTALTTGEGEKVGVRSFPTSLEAAKAHMKAIGSSVSVIGFASGKDQMQAFVSGDLDYIIMSTESLARGLPNTTCFATSAPTTLAKEHMPTRVAYESVNPNVPFNGFGLWPVLVGANVDNQALHEVFTQRPGELYQKLRSSFIPETNSITNQLLVLDAIGDDLKAVQ